MQRDCTTERIHHFLWMALLVTCQVACSNADPGSNLALSRDASAVAGTVIDEHTGKPLGDAYVTLYLDSEQDAPLAFPSATVTTARDGRFAFDHSRLRQSADARLTIGHCHHVGKVVHVDRTAGQPVDLGTIALPRGCRVFGTVSDRQDRTSWFDDVVLRRVHGGQGRVQDVVKVVVVTMGEGRYATTMPLSAGTWTVEVYSDLLQRNLTIQTGGQFMIRPNQRSLQHDVVVDALAQ
ncbi:MAG: hypothetical protein KDC95_11570 [Planctomycetes bacterium]|nr:hypothetical protein [Planctomycetota bacterium]